MKRFKSVVSLVLTLAMLLGSLSALAAFPQLRDEATGSEEQVLQVQVTFEARSLQVGALPYLIDVPANWPSQAGTGELLNAAEPERGGRFWAESLEGAPPALEEVQTMFSAMPIFEHVQLVSINDNRFVHYVAPGENVRGFVFRAEEQLVLFKFQPAGEAEFTAFAEQIMSTLRPLGGASASGGAIGEPAGSDASDKPGTQGPDSTASPVTIGPGASDAPTTAPTVTPATGETATPPASSEPGTVTATVPLTTVTPGPATATPAGTATPRPASATPVATATTQPTTPVVTATTQPTTPATSGEPTATPAGATTPSPTPEASTTPAL